MQVTELTPEQLEELRQAYNYEVNGSTALTDSAEIPDSVLLDYYGGVDFVPDDFTAHNEELSHYGEITDAPGQLPALPMEIAI